MRYRKMQESVVHTQGKRESTDTTVKELKYDGNGSSVKRKELKNKIPKLKSVISEMKHSLEGLNSTSKLAEGKKSATLKIQQ